jgi:hypothetical protein
LKEAEKVLQSSPTGTRIIILSDGGENCSGDPVSVAKSIRNHFPQTRIDIEFIGWAPANVRQELSEVAAAGGGAFRESISSQPGRKPVSDDQLGAVPARRIEPRAGVDYPSINPDSIPSIIDFRGEGETHAEQPPAAETPKSDQKLDTRIDREPAETATIPLL